MTALVRIGLTVTAIAVATVLAGCSGGGGDGDGGDGNEIGYSAGYLTDNFQVLLVKGIEEQGKEQGANLLPATNADGDPAKQNSDITTLLSRGIKALIVTALDATAIVPAVTAANSANVPVVAVDQGADGGDVFMTVRADNVDMGKSACEEMGKRVGGKGTVLNLQGDLTNAAGRDRSDGFTSCMSEKFPEVEILSKPMEFSAEKCAEQAQTVISTTELAGVYMASDGLCLAPVRTALNSAGLTAPVGAPGHIVLVGIDGYPESLAAVREGVVDAVVSQPLNDYAKYAIFYAKAAAAGETFKEGPTDHNSEIRDDGGLLIDVLPAPVVTAENVDDPELWGNQ